MSGESSQESRNLAVSLPWEVILLLLAWVAAGQFAPASVDSVRDIYQAHAIASGNALPLEGPQLAHTVHVGPLWFYILAVPAALFGAWGGIALVVFLISALKYWLAYVLGRQLHSAQLGLLFALFLALPSWSSTQLIIWTHTSVLEAALLLYLLSLRRSYLQPGSWHWLLTGFCFSLALHAHPTALPFVFLLPLAWRSLKQRWQWAACLVLGIAIPFLPYGVDQLINGFPDIAALQRYQAQEFSPGGPFTIFRLLYSVAVIGPLLYYKTVLPVPLMAAATILHGVLITALLSFGLWRFRAAEAGLKQLLIGAAVMLALVLVTVVLIRARTPWHMAYAPSFALAFFYAVLALIAFKAYPWSRVRALLSTAVISLFLAAAVGTSHKLYSNSIRFQEGVLFDVKNLRSPWGPTGLQIPAFSSWAHARFLCQQLPVVLHGPYAAMVDAHTGLEAEMGCGGRKDILIGGVTESSGYTHLAGVTAAMSRVLGSRPDWQVGNIHFYSPLAVSDAGRSVALAEGDSNPPRQVFTGGSPDAQSLALESDVSSALLISKPVGKYLALDIHHVTCNGSPAHLAIRSNYAWLYQCDGYGEGKPMRWQLRYKASADDLIDAVLLGSGAD